MNNTKQFKSYMVSTKATVIKLLGITEKAYDEYLYDVATDWLLDHLHNDTLVVFDVMEHEAFWTWWRLQTYHRNDEWLKSVVHIKEPQRLLNDWFYFHSATRLLDMKNKHAQILYNSYANINWY
jgi:hypothetical protein